VFALEPIPEGTQVWRFTPGFDLDVDPALVHAQPEPLRERLLHYGYIDPRLGRYILCCDDARFLNHSDAPNLRSDFTLDRYGVDTAARDIAPGEGTDGRLRAGRGCPARAGVVATGWLTGHGASVSSTKIR
jgi:SET domain-containing protein